MFTLSTLTAGAQAMADLITELSLHDAGDISSSGDESTVVRQPVTWDVVDGVITGSVTFEGGTPGDSPPRVGYWGGGTYRGGQFRVSGAPGFSPTGHLEVAVVESGYSV